MQEIHHIKSLNHTFKGQLSIGDPSFLEALEKSDVALRTRRLKRLVYVKTFKTKVTVQADIYHTTLGIELVLQLFNRHHETPVLSYSVTDRSVSPADTFRVTHKTLPTENANFTITTPYGFSDIDVKSNGDFGEVWSAKDATIVVLRLNHVHTTADSVAQLVDWLFEIDS